MLVSERDELLVIAKELESVEPLDVAVSTDTWTEVNVSRKKKNQNNHVTFSQTVESLEPKEDMTSTEESVTSSHSQVCSTDQVLQEKANTKERKVSKPLEEIKDLFFHEKPVEIVELARPERTEKVPKKRMRQKAKSKRAFLSEANKTPLQTTTSQRRSR